jgi:hypothetical protein
MVLVVMETNTTIVMENIVNIKTKKGSYLASFFLYEYVLLRIHFVS